MPFKDPDKRRAYHREANRRFRLNSPEKLRAAKHRHYLKNHAAILAYSREYSKKHRKELAVKAREYHRTHRSDLLAKMRIRREKIKSPERMAANAAAVRAYYLAHPEKRPARLDYSRRYYRQHQKTMYAQSRARIAQKPDEHRAYMRAYARERYRRNPESHKLIASAQSARRRGAEGHFGIKDIRALLVIQYALCACVGCGFDLSVAYHIDHIQPISRGGSNWPSNLQLLCPRCNHAKHAKALCPVHQNST